MSELFVFAVLSKGRLMEQAAEMLAENGIWLEGK
jgi:ATP phosphoribosyltransferase